MLALIFGLAVPRPIRQVADHSQPAGMHLSGNAKPELAPEPRELEVHPVGAVVRISSNRFSHPADVLAVAVSADGATVYTTAGYSAYAWDLDTGLVKWRTDGLRATWSIREVGNRVWVGPTPTVELDRITGRVVETWPDIAPEIDLWPGMTPIAGKRFVQATGALDANWERVVTIRDSLRPGPSIKFQTVSYKGTIICSPDGSTLAVNMLWRKSLLYSTETGKRIGEIKSAENQDEDVIALAFLPDKKFILVAVEQVTVQPGGHGWYDNRVEVWPLDGGKARRLYPGPEIQRRDRAEAVRICADGSRFAFYSTLGNIWEVVDYKTGRLLQTFPTPWAAPGQPRPGDFTPDGKRFVTLAGTQQLIVYDVATGAPSPQGMLTGHVSQLRWPTDGKLFAVTGRGVGSWDPSTGQRLGWATLPNDLNAELPFLDLSPDGQRVAYATRERTTACADLSTGQRWALDTTFPGVFSADGFHIAVMSKQGARIVEAGTGKLTHTLGKDYPVTRAAFTADGRFLVAGSYMGGVRVWEVATSRERVLVKDADTKVEYLTSLPGTQIAVAIVEIWDTPDKSSAELIVWNAATGEQLARHRLDKLVPDELLPPSGPDGLIFALQIHPTALTGLRDGKTVAVGDDAGRVFLIDVTTGKVQRAFGAKPQHSPVWTDRVTALAASPDGRFLASASHGDILIWELAPKR
jgi:WD40 repeat protein